MKEEEISISRTDQINTNIHNNQQPQQNGVKGYSHTSNEGINRHLLRENKDNIIQETSYEQTPIKTTEKRQIIDDYQIRNNIIDDYIDKLDGNSNDDLLIENIQAAEEDDEFDKAEALYKKSQSNQLEQGIEALNEYNQNKGISLKENILRIKQQKSLKNKFPAGYLYIKENDYIKRQRYRMIKTKSSENITPSKTEKAICNDNILINENNNVVQQGNTKPIGQFFNFQSIRYSRNPYLNKWSNNILKMQYNSKLEVEGSLNGSPTYRIQKLKNLPSLQTVILYINISIAK